MPAVNPTAAAARRNKRREDDMGVYKSLLPCAAALRSFLKFFPLVENFTDHEAVCICIAAPLLSVQHSFFTQST